MGQIASTKRRNFKEVLWRNFNATFFGETDVSGIEQNIACLNGEFVLGVNAAGTASVPLIGVNAANQVVAGNGSPLITAAHYAINLDAATAVSRSVFIVPVAYQLAGVNVVFGTASASGTVTVEKLTSTTAPGSGTVLLTVPLSTAGTANTVAPGVLIATVASLQFAVGDRVGLVFAATETGLVGLNVTLTFVRI